MINMVSTCMYSKSDIEKYSNIYFLLTTSSFWQLCKKNPNIKNKAMPSEYVDAIQYIKKEILRRQYRTVSFANRELLGLYFTVGKYVSEKSRSKNWGSGAINAISASLQQELPGLRGFSATNIKNMRLFYEEWEPYISFRQLVSAEMKNSYSEIRQLTSAVLTEGQQKNFLKIGFSHHREIMRNSSEPEERLFYIQQCAKNFWTVEKLKYNIKTDLFARRGLLQNNFSDTIENKEQRSIALNSLKDEFFLDFINIQDSDEETDERVLEHAIVNNIKKFIMALGADFCFVGNQYRLLVDDDEFFIDLLFFNRRIHSLVAIELKKGKFKAEYAGKMNFYLSALDELVRLPDENPSIGIILCKEKNNKVVEFSFRDTSKPMGVAIYKTAQELPEEYRDILPNAEKLKELL